VSAMLISRSQQHPTSSSTPIGGRKTAKMNLNMSMHVKAIMKIDEGILSLVLGGRGGRRSLLSIYSKISQIVNSLNSELPTFFHTYKFFVMQEIFLWPLILVYDLPQHDNEGHVAYFNLYKELSWFSLTI
jgi:hypothetical protein